MRAPIAPLPLNQLAFSVIDVQTTARWWRDGLGFLPAGGSRLLMRGPLIGAIQGVPGAAITCWCLLGRNDWAQVEMFQYEAPMSRLMPADAKPSDIGYTRCGFWVADLDVALANLAKLGTQPLTPPIGHKGARCVCVRNPDGVYVELMEDDPLPEQTARGRSDCPVAIRTVTMSTSDMAKTVAFLTAGLGMEETTLQLHSTDHEALWGLPGAQCTRKVFRDGSGKATMLLEVVEYTNPRGKPRREGYLVSDQGMLNICFGDDTSRLGVDAMHARALAAGAWQNCKPVHPPLIPAGCVYVNDPLGFSYEFMWCSPGRGHRDYGFVVSSPDAQPSADNQLIELSTLVPAASDKVFALLTENDSLSTWAGLGKFTTDRPGFTEANGVGAERRVASPLGTLREQVIAYESDRSQRYRVISGWPFVSYFGEIAVAPEKGGTRVNWTIRFRSRIPGLGPLLRFAVRRQFADTLTNKLPAALAAS
jgi:catechol 2,3-dioxygenase-like lactoylglutathione lyase family enzyme/uncharacterized protein YndB with AHSA1/START domain